MLSKLSVLNKLRSLNLFSSSERSSLSITTSTELEYHTSMESEAERPMLTNPAIETAHSLRHKADFETATDISLATEKSPSISSSISTGHETTAPNLSTTPSITDSLETSSISLDLAKDRKRKQKQVLYNLNPFYKRYNRVQVYKKAKARLKQKFKEYPILNNLILILYHLDTLPFANNLITMKINGDDYSQFENLEILKTLCREKIKEEDIHEIFNMYLTIIDAGIVPSGIALFKNTRCLIFDKIKKKHKQKVLFQTTLYSSNMYYFWLKRTIILFNCEKNETEGEHQQHISLNNYKTIYIKYLFWNKLNKEKFYTERFSLRHCFVCLDGEFIVIKKTWRGFKIYRSSTKNFEIKTLSDSLDSLGITKKVLFESIKLMVYIRC
ncbi:hypothetical protein CDIK_1835 [Cucumispora dikerogammari]|nr:hypothetical protein CDIK_1835 [Cucumispora dikerogammari]